MTKLYNWITAVDNLMLFTLRVSALRYPGHGLSKRVSSAADYYLLICTNGSPHAKEFYIN